MNQIIEATIDGEIIKLEDFGKPEILNVTDVAILELEKKHKGLKVTDNKELKTVTAARKEVRDLRLAVQNRNNELKKSLNNAKKSIDFEAERIIDKLKAIENPLDKEIKDYQEEQARIKREAEAKEAKRIADIQQRITTFENQGKNLHGKTSAELKEKLDFFQACVANDVFKYEEFSIQADKVKMQVGSELKQAYEAKKTQEEEAARIAEERKKIEEEKAELERQRQELAAQAEKEVAEKEAAKLVEEIAEANIKASESTLYEDLKEGLEEAIEFDKVNVYIANQKDPIGQVEVPYIKPSPEIKGAVFYNSDELLEPPAPETHVRSACVAEPQNQNSDNKIIVHKKIMDSLLKEGVEYNQAGEFLKLLQENAIPHVSINYEEC